MNKIDRPKEIVKHIDEKGVCVGEQWIYEDDNYKLPIEYKKNKVILQK